MSNRLVQDVIGLCLVSTVKVGNYYETAVFRGQKLPPKKGELPINIDWERTYYWDMVYSPDVRTAKRQHGRILKEVREGLKRARREYRQEERIYVSPDF